MIAKWVKTVVGVGLLDFGSRAAARYAFLDVSMQAAVVAPGRTIRAPIAGNITKDFGGPGRLYQQRETITEIRARTPDEDHLREGTFQLAKAKAELDALASDRPQLARLEKLLRSSSGTYAVHRVSQLQAELAQADPVLLSAQAREAESATKLVLRSLLLLESPQPSSRVQSVSRVRSLAGK